MIGLIYDQCKFNSAAETLRYGNRARTITQEEKQNLCMREIGSG